MRIILILILTGWSSTYAQRYNFNQFINYKVITKNSTYETPIFADSLNYDYVLKLYPNNLAKDNGRIFDKKTAEIHFLKLTQTDQGISSEYLYTIRMNSSEQIKKMKREILATDSLTIAIKWPDQNKKKKYYSMNCKFKPGSKVKNGLMLFLFSIKNGGYEDEVDENYSGLIESCSTDFGSINFISYQKVKIQIQIPTAKKYEKWQ